MVHIQIHEHIPFFIKKAFSVHSLSPLFTYDTIRVTQIQNGAAMTNNRMLNANEDVPVRSYSWFWLPMMMPEKAGGKAPAKTIICSLSPSMWKSKPTTSKAAGININF